MYLLYIYTISTIELMETLVDLRKISSYTAVSTVYK